MLSPAKPSRSRAWRNRAEPSGTRVRPEPSGAELGRSRSRKCHSAPLFRGSRWWLAAVSVQYASLGAIFVEIERETRREPISAPETGYHLPRKGRRREPISPPRDAASTREKGAHRAKGPGREKGRAEKEDLPPRRDVPNGLTPAACAGNAPTTSRCRAGRPLRPGRSTRRSRRRSPPNLRPARLGG